MEGAGEDRLDTSERTVQLPTGEVPAVAAMARVAAGERLSTHHTALSLTTAADAMRNEEVERTRLFIRMGWVLSVVSAATVPLVDAPRWISIVFLGGMLVGMVVSFGFHRAFADPVNYTERALAILSVICIVNGHIGVLFYGAYTACPMIVVVGIHFVARTEAQRVARLVLISALVSYAAISVAIIAGLIGDQGVFSSDRPIDRAALLTASVFVMGSYSIAYYTARAFRRASLASIEDLQRATRLASQREALMDELRADLERALQVGGPGRYTDHIVGKLRLGIVLGRGAMGEVYDAKHVETGAPAAVKLLRRELLADATVVARFLREVRASGSLDSRHVVRVLEASAAEASLPYLAMERLAGRTLAELFRGEPRLGGALTLDLVTQAAAGIDAASAAGIVHRDLKPQNLFRTEDGVWKILDFGVATLADDTGTLTQGGVVGTPHYMAPEQAQGKRVDSRADLYALAAISYRCVTGRHPFHAADTPALLYAVVHRMPVRPRDLADLSPDLDRWYAVALAKSPDDRFATGADMTAAFAAAFVDALDGKLRKRADALIRRHPWETA